MVGLQKVLTRLASDLKALERRWALVGGLAVSARAEPRTTRDLDVAIAVDDDRDAERLVAALRDRGYSIQALLEQEVTGRLATVRLLAPGEEPGGVIVDLLFASSGVEPEIVEAAELLDILPTLVVPVVTLGHLLALKTLAARAKDLADIECLLEQASASDVGEARSLLKVIQARGCARNKDLLAEFSEVAARHGVGRDGEPS